MIDSATGSESGGSAPASFKETLGLNLRFGYCADCGTWDAHGRVCAACGYDFAPPPAPDMVETAV